jgi:hypothetical protein
VVRLGGTGRGISNGVGTVVVGLAVWSRDWCGGRCIVGFRPMGKAVGVPVEKRDAAALGLEAGAMGRRWCIVGRSGGHKCRWDGNESNVGDWYR